MQDNFPVTILFPADTALMESSAIGVIYPCQGARMKCLFYIKFSRYKEQQAFYCTENMQDHADRYPHIFFLQFFKFITIRQFFFF